jgi:hypothetical protein
MFSIETRHLFTMTMKSERQVLGATPWGQRRVVVVTEASIEGPRINATLLPGGSDWVTEATDGTSRIDCRLVFRTEDGSLIGIKYQGLRHGTADVVGRVNRGEHFEPSEIYHRVAMFFETAATDYLWLNGVLGVGLIRHGPSGPVYEIFEVL